MIIELKLFAFWVIFLGISYIVAYTDYVYSGTSVYFKYYDSWTTAIYWNTIYFGIILIIGWSIIQFTYWFFCGSLVLLKQ